MVQNLNWKAVSIEKGSQNDDCFIVVSLSPVEDSSVSLCLPTINCALYYSFPSSFRLLETTSLDGMVFRRLSALGLKTILNLLQETSLSISYCFASLKSSILTSPKRPILREKEVVILESVLSMFEILFVSCFVLRRCLVIEMIC